MDNKKQTEALGRIFQQLRELERLPRHIKEVGSVSPSEFHLIEQIGLEGKITSKELRQQLSITKGAVSQLVKKLSHQGFIYREAIDADKRAYYLCLTTLGQQVFNEHQGIQQRFNDKLNHSLSVSEQLGFNKGLAVLSDLLREQLNKAGEERNER